MANYNLVTTSTFQPFTYNELMAPIQEVEKQYDAAETSMSELESKVSLIKDTLPENSEEYRKATSFLKDLDKGIEDLKSKGVSSTLSRKMFDLSRQYNRELVPLAQKSEMLKEAQKTRSQILAKDPTAIFVNDLPDIKDISIGENIDNTVVPTESILKNALNQVVNTVMGSYTGRGEFDINSINKNAILRGIEDSYNIDFNDPKYSTLKSQLESTITTGAYSTALERMKTQQSNVDARTKEANLALKSLELKEATDQKLISDYTNRFIIKGYDNEKNPIIEPNPIIYNKDMSYTALGKSLYEKSSSGKGAKEEEEEDKNAPTNSLGTKVMVVKPSQIEDPSSWGDLRNELEDFTTLGESVTILTYKDFYNKDGTPKSLQELKSSDITDAERTLFDSARGAYGKDVVIKKVYGQYYIHSSKTPPTTKKYGSDNDIKNAKKAMQKIKEENEKNK